MVLHPVMRLLPCASSRAACASCRFQDINGFHMQPGNHVALAAHAPFILGENERSTAYFDELATGRGNTRSTAKGCRNTWFHPGSGVGEHPSNVYTTRGPPRETTQMSCIKIGRKAQKSHTVPLFSEKPAPCRVSFGA